jgi:hypothetical protein
MRRALSISLLFPMLFQAAGQLFVFKIQQYEIRQEIKEQIKAGVPEAELVLLKIPKALEEIPHPAFQRIHKREFRYDGKMYDIVRQIAHGDTTWYYCLCDEKETQLLANLDELVKQDMTGNPQHRKQIDELLRLLGALYCSHKTAGLFIFPNEQNVATLFFFSLKTWDFLPSTPPPEA